MNIKKIIASVLVFTALTGTFTAIPSSEYSFGISASAAETSDSDFIIKNSYGQKKLTGYKGKGGKITIPDGISSIGSEAFKGNGNITEVVFPEGLDNVYKSAFEGCTKLKKVTFKGDIEAVDQYAFSGCASLKSVTFGGDIEKISLYAFSRCTALETVVFKGDIAYPSDSTAVNGGGIWEGAFSDCHSLKSVEFAPNSKVDMIAKKAFRNCFKLKSINLPSGLLEIGMDAFLNCSSLTGVSVYENTTLKNRSLGYAYNSDGKDKFFVADGKSKGKDSVSTADNKEKTSSFTPKALTLYVVKGSDAEKYASKNGIKYSYIQNGLASPTGFTASASSESLTIRWFDVSNAEVYFVYMYNTKTKAYERYQTVKGTKCTVKGLKAGSTYKFKVSAGRKINGKYKTGAKSSEISLTTKK